MEWQHRAGAHHRLCAAHPQACQPRRRTDGRRRSGGARTDRAATVPLSAIEWVPAKPLTVGLDGRVTGEAVLAHAKALGCDLLIKGAYTQSRLRQMIFGGTT